MLELALPRISSTENQQTYGSFEIEPLEAGYGRTLGNALRRVLLSSLPGAAITSVKIEGAQHEFQDVPGVKEDVTDIVLNLKQIRLRSFSDRPVTMRVVVTGQRDVTAADIQAPSTVEVVTPDVHICTLDDENSTLDIELVVESGKGYVPAETKEGQTIGQIPVDAIFSPVERVNYIVENTRVGQMTNYDRITLQIWTDGTVAPDEALRRAANILVEHFRMIASIGGTETIEEEAIVGVPGQIAAEKPGRHGVALPIPAKVYDTPVEELDLSVRAYNCLKRSGITKVGQVLTMNEDDLLAVRNFGEKSLNELRDSLLAHNLLPSPDQVDRAGAGSASAVALDSDTDDIADTDFNDFDDEDTEE